MGRVSDAAHTGHARHSHRSYRRRYGALAVLRLLAIARWALAFSLLSDPVLLSWQYRVEVRSTFRLKYLFQKRPVLVLSAFIATCWSCCSFW